MNLETLGKIFKIINKEKVLWCVGGSFLLLQYNLVDEARDIDILVNEDDALRLHNLLLPLGEYTYSPPNKPYLTKHFFHHRIDDVEVDIIGGFKIKHTCGIYNFHLDDDSISTYKYIDNMKVPLSTLEDWYVLYQLIPNREDKVKLIREHFWKVGIEKPQILQKALSKKLPNIIRSEIEELISKISK